jgi:flagellar FliL protein
MADTADTDAPKKKKGGLIKTILMVIGGVAFLGGGFYAGIFYSGQQMSPSEEVLKLIEQDEAEAAAEAEAEAEGDPEKVAKDIPETALFATSYYEFPDPLTTNLSGSSRFLQIGIGLSTQYDQSVITHVETHAMAIRSDMLAVISGFSESEIQGKEGRDRLSAALKAAVNDRLIALEGFGGIEDVFFPSFVMQ